MSTKTEHNPVGDPQDPGTQSVDLPVPNPSVPEPSPVPIGPGPSVDPIDLSALHRSVFQSVPDEDTSFEPPAADRQWLDWLYSHRSGYKFYFFTVTFNDSSFEPRPSRYLSIYETYVRQKLLRLVGYSHEPVTDVREYECGLIAGGGNPNCPHHVHSIIAVPVSAPWDRVENNYHKALAGRRGIASVKLSELPTNEDIRKTYFYLRKGKWHRPMGTV